MPRRHLPALFLMLACTVQGQGLMDRKRPDLIPLDGQVRRIGWFVAPGVTWTHTRAKNTEEQVFRNGDTSYFATYDPNGRPGLYLEAGLSWYTRDPVIVDYLDAGIAYKNVRGREVWDGRLQRADSVASISGEGEFAERMLTAHFNANRFFPTWRYQFVQVSLGVNVDYRLGSGYAHTADPLLNQHEFPPDLWGQAHFKLGYGFKLTGRLFVIPTLETPVFSVMPSDDGRFGSLQWFSSEYRPIIFSVRFLFLRARKGFDCPPPIKHKGQMKQYKQDGYHP